MNIKAIALDMDGTLLDPNGLIDPKLINLLSILQENHIRIFLATGRTRLEINDVLPEKIHIDGFVTANGMGCYTKTKEIAQHTLAPNLVANVVSQARKENMYYEIHPVEDSRFALLIDKEAMENEVFGEKVDTLLDNEYNSRKYSVKNKIHWVKELNTEDIVKVYFFSMDPYKISNWKNKLERLSEKEDFSTSSSSLHNVEIMVGNVSKATGIKMLLEEYGLSREDLMAIGDGENDLSLFELATHAVAMQNAEAVVKTKADEVTKLPYDQNGLYEYLLERFTNIFL